jgi:hypothetical protein
MAQRIVRRVNKTLLLLGTVLALLALAPRTSRALDVVQPPGKQWEYTVSTGYTDFTHNDISGAFDVWLRAQYRMIYPVLFGMGVEAGVDNNLWYAGANLPLTLRTGIGKIKFDFVLSPGFAYAQNTRTSVSKWVGTATGGLEIKTFFTKGTSVGVGGYYTYCSDSNLNNIKLNLVVGF